MRSRPPGPAVTHALRVACLAACFCAGQALGIEEKISLLSKAMVTEFIEDYYGGSQAVVSIEASYLRERGRTATGYLVRTECATDFTCGRRIIISNDGEDWHVWRERGWFAAGFHDSVRVVAVMDSIRTDVARGLVEFLRPQLGAAEFPTMVSIRKQDRAGPGANVGQVGTHYEVWTGFSDPWWQGRTFHVVAGPDSTYVAGVFRWES